MVWNTFESRCSLCLLLHQVKSGETWVYRKQPIVGRPTASKSFSLRQCNIKPNLNPQQRPGHTPRARWYLDTYASLLRSLNSLKDSLINLVIFIVKTKNKHLLFPVFFTFCLLWKIRKVSFPTFGIFR